MRRFMSGGLGIRKGLRNTNLGRAHNQRESGHIPRVHDVQVGIAAEKSLPGQAGAMQPSETTHCGSVAELAHHQILSLSQLILLIHINNWKQQESHFLLLARYLLHPLLRKLNMCLP